MECEEETDALDPLRSPQLTPRTIPFRSASFSQVDMTSEGKYVRSPITLKPTAFCLMTSTPYTTLPRSSPRRPPSSPRVTFQIGDPNYEDPASLPADPAPGPASASSDKSANDPSCVPTSSDKSLPKNINTDTGSSNNSATPDAGPDPCQSQGRKKEKGTNSQLQRLHRTTTVGKQLSNDVLNEVQEESEDSSKVAAVAGMTKDSPEQSSSAPGAEEQPTSDRSKAPRALRRELGSGGGGSQDDSSGSHSQSQDSTEGDVAPEKAFQRGKGRRLSSTSEKARIAFQLGLAGKGVESLEDAALRRQSSGQSDGSDQGQMSDPCGSPPVPHRHPSTDTEAEKRVTVSPPPLTSSYSLRWGSSGSAGRYTKRPLRGPYGEMLEKEMRSRRELRESKSSSPPDESLLKPLLMASMDDLRAKRTSRKIPQEDTVSVAGAFHQRTSSSPSQLQYAPIGTTNASLESTPRGHVLAELVETEASYVESLRIIVKRYIEPLKTSDFIDTGLVDEIFFQIPAILWHHERLLEALQRRVTDDTQSIGDVLLDAFRQNSFLECYSLFVNNWKNAKGSLKMAVASKPALARFLEQAARQHKGKLSLDSLLIMPIQRIPRYELLIKELLKHTEPIHDDHSRLMLVLDKIKKFAVHIDCASVDPNDNREMEIEGWTAGLGHLVRQDLVTLSTPSNVRKERALFLFADSIVIASLKRKSTMRKTSSTQAPWMGGASLDGCKFKLLLKVSLPDVHISSEEDTCGGRCRPSDDLDDLKTLHKMMELASMLRCPHGPLDDILREMSNSVRHHCDNNPDTLDIEIKAPSDTGSDPIETLKIQFGSAEKKSAWLDSFHDTLGKFVRYGFGKTPHMQFLQAVAIRKTRAGLLLSCAAPVSINPGAKELSDVWVANSDGYVGQICILTLHPEPSITSCNGVCNSRISCILSVPPRSQRDHYESDEEPSNYPKSKSPTLGEEPWSIWLGTEDGSLQIYDCADSVRVKKNRHKYQHKAPLQSIVYFEGRVLVSLANGDVAVYSRNSHGRGWLLGEPRWISMGTAMEPVTKMLVCGDSLWVVCDSQLKVYGDNGGMMELLHSLHTPAISTFAVSEDTVWVATHASSSVHAYSTASYHPIASIDVAADVAKILQGCDDIIRQHKSACLRVTAILVAPDKTLWIGTSAGVILTLTAGKTRKLTALSQGHTGQVRFLCSCSCRDYTVIISGGDGCEEFRPGMSSVTTDSGDLSGREDSTNHLLIWKIPRPYNNPNNT